MPNATVRRVAVPLLMAALLLVSACGRLSGTRSGAAGPEGWDMTRIATKTPLGEATLLFAALPSLDGTWTALAARQPTDGQLPCDGLAGSWEVVALRAGADPVVVEAPDGTALHVDPLQFAGPFAVPPAATVGDPIAVSAWSCDPSSPWGSRGSLLLGTIGDDGLPVDLRPIAGAGAPDGAPGAGAVGMAADRKSLVLISETCADVCEARRWNYDLVRGTWSEGDDTNFPREGDYGEPWVLADGSLIEVFDDGMSPRTTYRGGQIFDDTVRVDLAPDGRSALLNVLQHSSGYAEVVLLEAGGEFRTLYEREVASADDRYWGAPMSAVFLGDGSTAYFDQVGTSSWHVLWKMDIATGTSTELVELPEVVRYTLLPDGSGLIVEVADPSHPEFNAWELWTFPRA